MRKIFKIIATILTSIALSNVIIGCASTPKVPTHSLVPKEHSFSNESYRNKIIFDYELVENPIFANSRFANYKLYENAEGNYVEIAERKAYRNVDVKYVGIKTNGIYKSRTWVEIQSTDYTLDAAIYENNIIVNVGGSNGGWELTDFGNISYTLMAWRERCTFRKIISGLTNDSHYPEKLKEKDEKLREVFEKHNWFNNKTFDKESNKYEDVYKNELKPIIKDYEI